MFLTTKEIIYFILTLTVIFFFSNLGLLLVPKFKISNSSSMAIMSILATILLLLVYKFANVSSYSKDSFLFEVSGPKQCEGGPYMISSASPELQDYCKKLWSTTEGISKYNSMNCSKGFEGRPVHFDYTPESNDKWKNERCNPPYLNMNDPCVL